MTDVDVQAVLHGLKGFQRDAVDHLIGQFYPEHGEPASRRFLIADETGLGKSIIARRFNADGVPTFGNSEGWHPETGLPDAGLVLR